MVFFLSFLFLFLFCFGFALHLFYLFFFFWLVALNFSFVKTDKEGIVPWLPLGLANTLSVSK